MVVISVYTYGVKIIKGALDNFSLIPNFFSKKLRFLYH